MGVCPQHDILWDDLTIEEHLLMFGKLKQIPEELLYEEVYDKLRSVELLDKKDCLSRTLSGGMKRRLSIAIAFIGNPKIVFLDEPTTGMDPNTRQSVWKLIKELKSDKVIILTTHAMEEADILSDRIAVMVEGSITCIGTPIYLKNNFGEGYRLSLVVSQEDIPFVTQKMKQIIPSCIIVDESGGSIIISIPIANRGELKNFFRYFNKFLIESIVFIRIIEDKENYDKDILNFKSKIYDWGLSHSTLEEVFMKVKFIKSTEFNSH